MSGLDPRHLRSPRKVLTRRVSALAGGVGAFPRHFGAVTRAVAAATLVGSLGVFLASGTLPVQHLTMEAPYNPTTNIAPNPDFLSAGTCSGSTGSYSCTNPCVSSSATFPAYTNDPLCTAYVLSAINNARTDENLAPMVLPSNWDSLTVPEQMLVVTDLERVARGYPAYLGLNAALDRATISAAMANSDPALASGFRAGYDALGQVAWGGSWSSGFDVLAGDYLMFYDDGWGGALGTSNVACVSPGSRGCWAHRDELLGSAPHFNDGVSLWCATCEMGAGYALVNGASSYVQLIELPAAGPPPMVFTWQSEVSYFPTGALGSVKTVSLARVSFRGAALKVAWTLSGAQDASLAAVYTFSGPTCARLGRVSVFHYVATFNIRRSTVTLDPFGDVTRRARASAVVRLYTPSGSLTSNCLNVGVN
ncbi:MAG: hypothetical protein WAN30_00470 [Acidimicrobiales bacterium]